MKSTLLLVALCISTYGLQAQPKFINNTGCDVNISFFCYDNSLPNCPISQFCTAVSVSGGNSELLSNIPSSCCSGPNFGYQITYTSGACVGTRVRVTSGWAVPSNCYGVSMPGNCPPCNGGVDYPLAWDVSGNLTLN